MNRFENVCLVSFYGGETNFVEFDAAWAGFLEAEDQFSNSQDVEFGLNGAEDLENIVAIAQLVVCILYNTVGQDSLPTN